MTQSILFICKSLYKMFLFKSDLSDWKYMRQLPLVLHTSAGRTSFTIFLWFGIAVSAHTERKDIVWTQTFNDSSVLKYIYLHIWFTSLGDIKLDKTASLAFIVSQYINQNHCAELSAVWLCDAWNHFIVPCAVYHSPIGEESWSCESSKLSIVPLHLHSKAEINSIWNIPVQIVIKNCY